MILTPKHIDHLEKFLAQTHSDSYPEWPMELHDKIISGILPGMMRILNFNGKSKVLDVGCGQGSALKIFREMGIKAIGITVNQIDWQKCSEQSFDVRMMDQSFLEFDDNEFDLVWCRHCLEHSFLPFYTLTEFNRVLKMDRYLYVEVPASDTDFKHHTNENHYSIFPESSWVSLITRSGYEILKSKHLELENPKIGHDTYFSFVCKKVEDA